MKRIALLVMLLGILSPSVACAQNDVVLTTDSPSKTRRVSIQRKYSDKRTQVTLTTTDLVTGQSKALPYPIYYEGVFDPIFERYYSDHSWLAENVLWLGNDLKSAKHSITIENRGSTVVECLEIRTEDIYFVFDLRANQRVVVPLVWTDNKREIVFFKLVAHNEGGVVVESKEFPFPKENHAWYVISVDEGGAKILSSSN